MSRRQPPERKRLRCCDQCARFDTCSFAVERCFVRSRDCDSCFECKTFQPKPSPPGLQALERAMARG